MELGSSVKIICFAEEDWNDTGKRVQHLMRELSERREVEAVLYVNPPLSHSIKDALQGRVQPTWSGLPRELHGRALLGWPNRVSDKVVAYTGSDKLLPLTRFGWIRQLSPLAYLNRTIYLSRIQSQLRRLPGASTIVWVSYPLHAPVAMRIRGRALLVYDWMDDWEQFKTLPVADVGVLRAATESLVRSADVVLAVSDKLHRRARALNPNSHLVPNGTHFDRFALPLLPVEGCLAAVPRPRLGYVGRIGDRIDFSLLEGLVRAHPEWSLVLVGPVWEPVREEMDRIQRYPSVFSLGPRPYDELPALIAGFDVCLIPHTVDMLTASMDPIKLYDYLAAGKPVVTTAIAGTERFADLLYVAESPFEFEAKVAAALEERDPDLVERRQRCARENSWETRAAQIWALIREAHSRRLLGTLPAGAGQVGEATP